MKILQVVPYLYPALSYGGPAVLVYQLAKELSKRYELSIYTTDAFDEKRRLRPSDIKEDPRYFSVTYSKNLSNCMAYKHKIFFSPSMIYTFWKKKDEVDLVHLHDFFVIHQIIITHICRLLRKPYYLSPHGTLDPTRLREKRLLKRLFMVSFGNKLLNGAEMVIATSEREKNHLKKLTNTKIEVVYNGVRLRRKTEEHRKPPKAAYKKNTLRLLYLGRLHKLKGLDTLLLAVHRLKTSKIQVNIVGPDDGYRGKLEELVNKKKVKGIKFLGPIYDDNRKEGLFDSTDIFVYPSKSEGFSISILEAMSYGKPVIISEACNFSEIEKEEAGTIFESGNVESLAQAIEKFIENRKSVLEKGRNARQLVRKRYSIKAMADRMAGLYKQVALK